VVQKDVRNNSNLTALRPMRLSLTEEADCCLGKVKPFQFNTQERAVETERVRREHPCETSAALFNAGMSLT